MHTLGLKLGLGLPLGLYFVVFVFAVTEVIARHAATLQSRCDQVSRKHIHTYTRTHVYICTHAHTHNTHTWVTYYPQLSPPDAQPHPQHKNPLLQSDRVPALHSTNTHTHNTHTHIHTRTHTHKHIHAYTHTRIHTRTHTHKHIHAYTHTQHQHQLKALASLRQQTIGGF